MKYALALVLFACVTPAQATDIPLKARVLNPGGYCCWTCLEVLGKMNGITPLHDMLEQRKYDPDDFYLDLRGFEIVPKNIGDDRSLSRKLKAMHIRHEMQHTGIFDPHLLEHANTEGCLVVCDGHGIVLTSYTDSTVEFYDPGDGKMHVKPRKWFDSTWSGLVIVVYP